MFTVKEIINDAYDRSGIFPNSTSTLPGEMTESALKVLRGAIATYNIQGILLPNQRSVEFSIDNEIKSEDLTEEGIASIQKVYLRYDNAQRAIELDYVPFASFPLAHDYTYTYNQVGEDFRIYFKKPLVGRTCLMHFITPIVCDLNTKYYLPFEYQEFFTLTLICKLLDMYPREDDTMKEGFLQELTSVRNAIVAKQEENKLNIYNIHHYGTTYSMGMSGAFLGV